MNLEKLHTDLRGICRGFNKVNAGGCGDVAAMIAIAVKDKFEEVRITSTDWYQNTEGNNIDHVRSLVNSMVTSEWTSNGIGFSHVWVEVYHEGKWYTLDATGVREPADMYGQWNTPYEGNFTVDEMITLASDGTWNKDFDRDQLPAIQAYINQNIH